MPRHPTLLGLRRGAGPVVRAHAAERRDLGEDARLVRAFRGTPVLAPFAATGDEHDGGTPAAPTLHVHLAAAPDGDQAGEVRLWFRAPRRGICAAGSGGDGCRRRFRSGSGRGARGRHDRCGEQRGADPSRLAPTLTGGHHHRGPLLRPLNGGPYTGAADRRGEGVGSAPAGRHVPPIRPRPPRSTRHHGPRDRAGTSRVRGHGGRLNARARPSLAGRLRGRRGPLLEASEVGDPSERRRAAHRDRRRPRADDLVR